jgi:hypothetical protein
MAVHDEAAVRARPRQQVGQRIGGARALGQAGPGRAGSLGPAPRGIPASSGGSVLSLACGGDEEIPLEIATTRSAREAYCLSQSSHPRGGSCA